VCRGCGAPPRPERQGRRLRVLQTLPSRRDCAGVDPGTGSRSDARMASALRRCAVLLRLVAHSCTPARRRSAHRSSCCLPRPPSGEGRRGLPVRGPKADQPLRPEVRCRRSGNKT
jgi:hypothetical protein